MNNEEKLKELLEKKLALLKKRQKYEADNAIEFFGLTDEKRKGLNPPQRKVFDAFMNQLYKVLIYSGGNRSGKTTIFIICDICVMLGFIPWTGEKLVFSHNKPRKIRIIGQDWEKHIKSVIEPALNMWLPKNRQYKTKKNNFGIIHYYEDVLTGSSIEILSNKQEVDVFEGWEGDICHYDEPPKREIRVACARGLVDRAGREFFGMTLLKEAWVDREVVKAVDEKGNPDTSIFSVTATIYDNVGFGITNEGVAQFAKTLTEDEKSARLMGVPSYMSGLVFPMFKRNIHVKERFTVPMDWMVDVHFDIHPREKQAVLFVATSPSGIRYVCDEIWENGDGTQIAEAMVRRSMFRGYRINDVLIDPLAKGDSNNPSTTYDKIDAVLARYGYKLEVASKDKDSGILLIKKHLKSDNNEPTLFFFNDLRMMIMEMEDLMYDDDTQKAQKKDDHFVEGLYRILLRDTRWYAMEEEDEDAFEPKRKVTSSAGY